MTTCHTAEDVEAASAAPVTSLPPLPDDPGAVSHDERAHLTAAYLAAAAAGGPEVREAAVHGVVLLNMRVAHAVARRYRNRGVSDDDLEQIADLALVRVARRFDPAQGRDFLAYAVPGITGELRRHFRDHGWVVRPPRSVQRAHGRILREPADLDSCSDETVRELAQRTGEDQHDVAEALRLRETSRPLSLDHLGAGANGAGMDIADARLDFASSADARMELGAAARDLSAEERDLLTWRFVDELPQRQIAERLGVSQVTVSRTLTRLLARLRELLDPVR